MLCSAGKSKAPGHLTGRFTQRILLTEQDRVQRHVEWSEHQRNGAE